MLSFSGGREALKTAWGHILCVMENLTQAFLKEIHWALNTSNKSSTGLYKPPRETGKVLFFTFHYIANKKVIRMWIAENCNIEPH